MVRSGPRSLKPASKVAPSLHSFCFIFTARPFLLTYVRYSIFSAYFSGVSSRVSPRRRSSFVRSFVARQSPLSLKPVGDYDVEELPHPDHVHVLEVLPPEEGETEGKRVEVAPSIGRFLLEHQVKHNIVCSLRGKSGMDEEEEQEDEWA